MITLKIPSKKNSKSKTTKLQEPSMKVLKNKVIVGFIIATIAPLIALFLSFQNYLINVNEKYQKLSEHSASDFQIPLLSFIIIGLGIIFIAFILIYVMKTLIQYCTKLKKMYIELSDQLIQIEKVSLMSEMAVGIVQEINNPLAKILLDVEILEDIVKSSVEDKFNKLKYEEQLHSIEVEAYYCKDLANKLLIFARPTGTTISLCNINNILIDSIELINRGLNLKKISFITTLESNLPLSPTDNGKIKQVFLNLLRNAVEAIDNNGCIYISTSKEEEIVKIEIKDTGIGIHEQNLSKIFFPFFTIKEAGKGTGLGLSISERIITNLGGKINVKSKIGEGTTFSILLPGRLYENEIAS